MKFEDAYGQYLIYIELKLKKQSVRSVKNRFESQIVPYWGNYDIYKIKEIDYLKYQQYIENKNFSYSYKKSLHFAFVNFLNYCITFYNLEKNIASKVGNYKNKYNEVSKVDFYTLDEFNKFIINVDDEVYKQFFNLMYYTGTRPGEAMALRFSDLNNSILSINKTISKELDKNTHERIVNSPKTRSSIRNIEIDYLLNRDLLKLKDYYNLKYNLQDFDYYIFGGIKPLSSTTLCRKKLEASISAGIKNIRLHDFRHSHATLLVENKMMINEISRRLGHSDVSITLNTYVHTNKEQEKRVINTLNSLRLNN